MLKGRGENEKSMINNDMGNNNSNNSSNTNVMRWFVIIID